MIDHREYAPPAVRSQMASSSDQQLDAAAYMREAVGYVERSLTKIDQDRAWIDKVYQEIAGHLGDGLFEDRTPGGPQAPIDPIVAGLLEHLPKPGAVWPAAERKQWLELFERTCNLVYKDAVKAETTPTTPPTSEAA